MSQGGGGAHALVPPRRRGAAGQVERRRGGDDGPHRPRHRAGHRAGGIVEQMGDQLLRPDGDELRPRGEQLLGGVHPPDHADGADPAADGLLDVADGVGDQHHLLSTLGRPGAILLGVLGLTEPAHRVAGIGEECPDARRLVGLEVAGEGVGEAAGEVVPLQGAAHRLHGVRGAEHQGAAAGELVDHVGHPGHEVGAVLVAEQLEEVRAHPLHPRRVTRADLVERGEEVAPEERVEVLRAVDAEVELRVGALEEPPGCLPRLHQRAVEVEDDGAGSHPAAPRAPSCCAVFTSSCGADSLRAPARTS